MEQEQIGKIKRKGQVGLDTSKAVMFSLLFIGVLGLLIVILLGNLTDTSVATTSGTIGLTSDTLVTVTETGELLSFNDRLDCSAVVSTARNATGGLLIPASNYTVSGCRISFNTGQGNANGFNNSNWIVNYTGSFNSFGSLSGNVTGGVANFFTNTSTWFAMLSVVIIILIIGIVIYAVNRFGGSSRGGMP